MRIANFNYCDRVENIPEPNGSTTTRVIDPLAKISPLAVPGNFSFSIATVIADVEDGDFIRLEFEAPNGEIGLKTEDIPLTLPNGIDPTGITLNFNLEIRNYPFINEGTYTMKAYNKGEMVGTYPIEVAGQQKFNPIIITGGKKR